MSNTEGATEALRLAAQEYYDALTARPEEAFGRIRRLAMAALRVPVAFVSLADKDLPSLISQQGSNPRAAPQESSFCIYAISNNDPLIVPDTLDDPRFRDHPSVVGEPRIRSYVGVPLRTHDGHRLGTLCVVDQIPRQFSEDQIDVLIDLAHLAVDELELRRLATHDGLTGVMTRRFFLVEVTREFKRTRRYGGSLSCIIFDIDNFKRVNDTYGHAAGDRVLKQLATFCWQHVRTVDFVGRLGGEEFAIALPETTISQAMAVAEKLRIGIEELDIRYSRREIRVTASFGISMCAAGDPDFKTTLKRADAALYQAKNAGRNRTVVLDPAQAASVVHSIVAANVSAA